MRLITVKMTVGFGESAEQVDFVVDVPDDWESSETTHAAMYDAFRADSILEIEDIECSDCGCSFNQCECDNEEEN